MQNIEFFACIKCHIRMCIIINNVFCRFDHTQCSHLQGKNTFAFSPFGYGPRRCPGYHFAYTEVSVFLAILLQQFTIKPVGEAKDVGRIHGLVTTPKEALKFQVHLMNQ